MNGDALHLLRDLGVPLLIVSAAATSGLILLLRPLLHRYALALPNARSSHKIPTPQGGGIAVIGITIAVVTVAVIAFPQLGGGSIAWLLTALVVAAALAVVGAIDDIRVIGTVPRLLLQMVAIGAVIAAMPSELRVVSWVPWWWERALLLLAMAWFVNLVNFMDGIDWMTVAEAVPVTAGLILIGALGGLPPYGVVVALALCGAMLGFAFFNRPVAKLFLGDVGSLPIGLLLGWLLLLVAVRGHIAAALLLPLYYVADATLTLLRRLLRGERIWEAHRSHFYQRAMDGGFDVLGIVSRVFAVNIALVILAAATIVIPELRVQLGALAVGGVLVGWLLTRFAKGKG
jgi:UDP-N-acetylmuramyl pentapeptide phosphotransferase/UDP-N-acetylglucosamine-1-phosphate transferase